jgi:hypothetical protein
MLRQRLYDEPPPLIVRTSPYQQQIRRTTMTHNNPFNHTTSTTTTSTTFPSLYNPELIVARPWDTSFTPDEIRLMRLNYLQNGGHDQNVLNRFTEMEYEARYRPPQGAAGGIIRPPIGGYTLGN